MSAGLQVLKMWIVFLRTAVLDCVALTDAETPVTKKLARMLLKQ